MNSDLKKLYTAAKNKCSSIKQNECFIDVTQQIDVNFALITRFTTDHNKLRLFEEIYETEL